MRPPESFIQQPVRSLQTMLRVIAEDDSQLPTVIPDGIYGPTTLTAVTAFQRREGLPATGITDQDTWERIVAAYEPARIRVDKAQPIEIIMDAGQIFGFGDSGPYVYLTQSLLIQLSQENQSIPSPQHNGSFDDATVEALKAFQILAGLPVTGQLDKITWKHLVTQYALSTHHYYANRTT